jgi:hypothetical protein
MLLGIFRKEFSMSDDTGKTYFKCRECGRQFYLVDKDMNFYRSQNFVMPVRCFTCRKKRKDGQGQGSGSAPPSSTET